MRTYFAQIIRRHSQAVRQRSAKPLFPSSILGGASKENDLHSAGRFFDRMAFLLILFSLSCMEETDLIEYRTLEEAKIDRTLFAGFERRQVVCMCRRRENDRWVVRADPFVDQWDEADYCMLVDCLRNTVRTGGFVCAAFSDGVLKGFVSVESEPMGADGVYLDLSSLHVSQEMRRLGIGRALFLRAADFARARGAKKLYISAHSAVETQAFYQAMGCAEAQEYDQGHVSREPFDCQMEYCL